MSEPGKGPRPGHSPSQRAVRMALSLLAIGLGWAFVMAPVFGIVEGLPMVLAAFGTGVALLLAGSRAFKMVFFDQ